MSTDATTTAGRQLADFVHGLRFADLPNNVVHAARRTLLDTLGAGIAGSTADEGGRVRRAVLDFDRGEVATLWGTNARSSAPMAALVNGTAAHALEMDDFHGCDHSGAVVIPAVLAVAQAMGGLTGRDLLTASVAGYEVARRPMEAVGGYDAHNSRGWHSTGTCGTFGAAAAAGRTMGLDGEQLSWAIGLAGSFTGGIWAFIDDGAMSKRLHPGKASENGVVAAYLARRGFTGPSQIFEATWGGFLSTYAPDTADPAALTEDLGQDYRILLTGFKPYASCRGVHSAIDALLELRDAHSFAVDDVERIVVTGRPFAVQMVGNAEIHTMLDAQMSLPYGLAVTLLTGDASIEQYTAEWRESPKVRKMLAKISMVEDARIPTTEEPTVEVQLYDGRCFHARVDIALGAAERPLSDEQLARKFRSLTSLALPEAQVDELLEMLWHIDDLDSVDALWPLLSKVTEPWEVANRAAGSGAG